MGVEALGMGLGTLIRELGVRPEIVTGHDFRGYSASVKMALVNGLLAAGCKVHDIGLALTPMAYFAQFELDVPAVAMVTASHNDNGWTGVKMGANRPLTFGPDEMTRLKEIVLDAGFKLDGGGSYSFVEGFPTRYIADLTKRPKLKRKLKVVCACGNGTAGAFAPQVLEAVGCEVVRARLRARPYLPELQSQYRGHEDAARHARRSVAHEGGRGARLRRRRRPLRCRRQRGRRDFRRQGRRDARARHGGAAQGRDLRRRREVDRPVHDRPGAAAARRQDRLLEDRPFLHQAAGQRAWRACGLREVRPLLLQPAARPRLRRRAHLRARGLRYARPQSVKERWRTSRTRCPRPGRRRPCRRTATTS